MKKSRSDLPFAALLAYSPKGIGEISIASRRVRDLVKRADERTLEQAVRRTLENREIFQHFFNATTTLIPVPRSAPIPAGRGGPYLWPADSIATALVHSGLAARVIQCIERVTAVRKSAFQAKGERPSVEEQRASLRIDARLIDSISTDITIVDDVVTKGRTLLAAAGRLQELLPHTTVRAFALVRTRGLVPEVESILDPCTGFIRWVDDDASRQP